MKAIFFYAVDRGAAPPVPLVVPAPEVTIVVPGDAIVHAESIGVGGEGAILLVVHHIAFLFYCSEVAASSSVVIIFSREV